MKEITLTIQHEVGLHARPAALFVKTAARFQSNIKVIKDSSTANAKSILSILGLAAGKGAVVTIQAEGADEDEAVAVLQALVESNFGE
ncbi:MAG: HPr family phosphocarrier protein [Chloroflexota bacterium]|nr:HPr family phosphocarrier protein [Chloroflexota bacterium]